MTLTLYHYTCHHGHINLGDEGSVQPVSLWSPPTARKVEASDPEHAWLTRLCWATDLEVGLRRELGLTSRTLQCDRTAYRYRVLDPSPAVRWVTWAKRLPYAERALLNSANGAMPMHWWVSEQPLLAVYDPM